MRKIERVIVYLGLVLSLVWLLVLTAIVAVKFGEINALGAGGEPAVSGGEDWWGGGAGAGERADPLTPTAVRSAPTGDVAQVGIAGLKVLTGSIEMTVTVRAYGAGDLLYEPPILVTDEGQIYQTTGESLEAARIAFLDLVTSGQTTARFVFNGRPSHRPAAAWLVFNPSQQPGSAIAPPLRVQCWPRTGGTGGQ